ncbi:HSP20-like chaperone [Suillus discolor]|uniref:HSP20-like chaperone n=1 Tax=Suillus discolor TaxID=1912936 RepID=A0A9P7JVB8_9AGAM|nr:HSP20-like chaperone [Suillus discolor]KAG2111234.1 HSP20-like chaperone [Suillus discolor]
MSLVRTFYDPFTEFDKLFDDAFNARFHPSPTIEGNTTLTHRCDRAFPRMDLHENAETKTVTATFELPGIKQQDVNVEVHGNRLTISGESKCSDDYNKGSYVVQERSRILQIPQGIKAEDVHAKMENGVLTVSFPKAGPDQQPQRIAIV